MLLNCIFRGYRYADLCNFGIILFYREFTATRLSKYINYELKTTS